ncbi:hypothetical protein HMPREF1550_00666 [Actinomyces sp. oral taxon 877 str. F0543]|nr:hypothetical protein HMPREF1550_00666 [Actinomyces sp. oral taxon 877 str. F0543]
MVAPIGVPQSAPLGENGCPSGGTGGRHRATVLRLWRPWGWTV